MRSGAHAYWSLHLQAANRPADGPDIPAPPGDMMIARRACSAHGLLDARGTLLPRSASASAYIRMRAQSARHTILHYFSYQIYLRSPLTSLHGYYRLVSLQDKAVAPCPLATGHDTMIFAFRH